MKSLSPISVAGDGNELYVLLSMAIYNTHDNADEVRHRIWNSFSKNVLGILLDDLTLLLSASPPRSTASELTRTQAGAN